MTDFSLLQLPLGTDRRGLNLSPPHGHRIWSGLKTIIAKGKPFDLSGPWLLVSGGKAYGTMDVGEPYALDVKTFDECFDQHRVTVLEREAWWPDQETLYLSDVLDFKGFAQPLPIRTFPGMQTVVEEVEFTKDEPESLAEHCDAVRFVIEAKAGEQEIDQIDGQAMPMEQGDKAAIMPEPSQDSITLVIEDVEDADNVTVTEHELVAELVVSEKEDDGMPYSVDKPPARVKNLPAAAQRIWVNAYNSAHKKYPNDESRCNKIAWGAVKNAGYHQDADGNWSKKEISTEPEQTSPKTDAPTEQKPESTSSGGVLERLKGRLEGLLGDLKSFLEGDQELPRLPVEVGFKSFTAKDGSPWLLTWTTNSFIDTEGEIFETKAIEEYVDRHQEDDVKGEFWFWHVPGSRFGEIKWQAVVGDRFLVEAGPFDDTPIGRKFREFFSEHPQSHDQLAPEGWGTSHGYYYGPGDLQDGVYRWFEKFETTVLPKSKASNQHSPAMEVLPMNAEQRKALEDVVGAELVTQIEQLGEDRTKELEEEGIAFKETAEDAPLEPVVKPDEPVIEAVEDVKVETDEKEVSEETETPEDETVVEVKEEAPAEAAEEDAETDVGSSTKDVQDLVQQIIAGLDLGGLAQAITDIKTEFVGMREDFETRLKALEDVGIEGELSPLIPMPHSALFRATRAAQTETDEKVVKEKAPTVPDVIEQFSKLVPLS